MKRSIIVRIIVAAVLVSAFVVVLIHMPRQGYQGPRDQDLLSLVKSDPNLGNRPAGVGNDSAEALLANAERKPAVPSSGVIALDDETFSPGYDELYNNREKYYGREISVSGYVETDNLPAGQFLIGRDLVWCCDVDKYFIGFLVITDEAIPVAGAELRVLGTIEASSYTDPESGNTFDVPAIRAKRVEPAQKFSRDVFPG